MLRYILALLLLSSALIAGGDGLIWMTCDVCGTKIHTNKAKLDKGGVYEKPVVPENVIQTTTATSNTSARITYSDWAQFSVGVANLPEDSEANSAVIAGHSNDSKHICKQCYDRFTPEIFRKVDDLWADYWKDVRYKMRSAREKATAGIDSLGIERKIDSLKTLLRQYR